MNDIYIFYVNYGRETRRFRYFGAFVEDLIASPRTKGAFIRSQQHFRGLPSPDSKYYLTFIQFFICHGNLVVS